MQSNNRSQAETTCVNVVKCSDCDSKSLTRDYNSGELVCDDCGLVLEENVVETRHEPVRSEVSEAIGTRPLSPRLAKLDAQVNASPRKEAKYSGWDNLSLNLRFLLNQNGYYDQKNRMEDAKRMYASMKEEFEKRNNTTSLFRGRHGRMRRAVVAHIIFNEMCMDPRPWYQKCQQGGMPVQPKKSNPEFKKLRRKIVASSCNALGPEGDFLSDVDKKSLDAFMRRMLRLLFGLLYRRSNDPISRNDRFLRQHELKDLRKERFLLMVQEVMSIHNLPLDSTLIERAMKAMDQHPSYPSYQNLQALDKFHLEILYQLILQRNNGKKIGRNSLLYSGVSSSPSPFYKGRSDHWSSAALEILKVI